MKKINISEKIKEIESDLYIYVNKPMIKTEDAEVLIRQVKIAQRQACIDMALKYSPKLADKIAQTELITQV